MAAAGVTPGRVAAARLEKKIATATGKWEKARDAFLAASAVLEDLHGQLAWATVGQGQMEFPPNQSFPDLLEGLEEVTSTPVEEETEQADEA